MLKNIAVAFVIGAVVGGIIAVKYQKPTVLTVEKEVVKNNVITKVVERTLPSGEKTIETVTVDKSVTKESKQVNEAPKKLDYGLGVTYSFDRNVGIIAQRRMLADLWLVGTLSQNGSASLGLLYEF